MSRHILCEVCNVSVPEGLSMRDHTRGKRHKRLALLQQKQQQQAEKSVYVGYFSPGTTSPVLQHYFSQFGRVERVQLFSHLNFAFVEFATADAVRNTLRKSDHFLRGRRMKVQPKQIRTPPPKNIGANLQKRNDELESKAAADVDLILKTLSSCNSLESQMKSIMQQLELTEDDVAQRQSIQDSLQNLFDGVFPGCEVHQFGSSVNGLGMKGCDMDLFLNLEPYCPGLQNKSMSRPLPYIGDIKSLRLKSGIYIDPDSLQEAPLVDQIKIVSRVLKEARNRCSNIMTIPGARCPVVKFSHEPTKMRCDMSITSSLALRNTRLIQFLCGLDQRLRPLMYTLRTWAKKKKVANSINSGPRLTSYALTMMAVFYLQNLQPPVLPSIEKLAELADETEERSGWDCTFTTDPSQLPPTTNHQTAPELLEGFFNFYAKFDFTNSVICPRTGKPTHMMEFKEMVEADKRLQTFRISPICIQDPFILNHNTASGVNEKTKFLLVEELCQAATKCSHPNIKPTESDSISWGLQFVFADNRIQVTDTSLRHICLSEQDPKSSVFSISMNFSKLPAQFVQSMPLVDLKNYWCQQVAEFVLKILSEVLLFDCDSSFSHAVPTTSTKVSENGSSSVSDVVNASTATQGTSLMEPISAPSSDESHLTRTYSPENDNLLDSFGQSLAETESLPKVADMKLCDATSYAKTSVKRASCEFPEAEVFCKRQKGDLPCETTTNASNNEVSATDSVVSNKRDSLETLANTTSTETFISNPEKSKTTCSLSQPGTAICKKAVNVKHVQSPVPLLWSTCSCTSRVWIGRKKIRSELRKTGKTESLELECEVSRRLLDTEVTPNEPLVFDINMSKDISDNYTAVIIKMTPIRGSNEFSCFYPFFRTFSTKMVDHYFPQ